MDTDSAESGSHDLPGPSLIDVSDIPFDELVGSTNAALTRALRSVTRDAADAGTILAAFTNFAPDDPAPL
jgi:FXSXX-COOH protein